MRVTSLVPRRSSFRSNLILECLNLLNCFLLILAFAKFFRELPTTLWTTPDFFMREYFSLRTHWEVSPPSSLRLA